MIPYYSANFIFNPYKPKFCGMKSRTPGHEKSCAGIEKCVSEFLANFFRRVLVDFRKMKLPIYHVYSKKAELKVLFLEIFFPRGLSTYLI